MNTPADPHRYPARQALLGEGMTIRRALPTARRRMIGAWCFLDHAGPVQFGPGQGMHVGAHPHIGLQTFTWMIEGEVIHRDSLGNEQCIRPGQVNLMTAGQGIAHTEDSAVDGSRLHLAQLWIALPDGHRTSTPAFENYPVLPQVHADGFVVTVLAGSLFAQTAPTRIHSPLVGADLLSAGPAHARLPLDPAFEYGLMVLRGTVTVEGEPLATAELLYFAPGRSELVVQSDGPAQVLLLGGAPFEEDVLLWWNFVARTQEEIEQARADWIDGSSRFGTVRPGSPAGRLDIPSVDGARLRASR